MLCHNVEQRIQELLDNRLDPSCDFELIDHASTCSVCRELLEAQGKLFEGLSFLAVPGLSADFSRRVVGNVVTQRPTANHRLAPAAAFLAIIATLLLVVALGPRQHKNIEPADDPLALASASLNHPIDDQARGHSMADFDSREVRMAIQQFVAQLTSGDAARFYQVDQLAGTIGPLASTLNVAFDAIRRSIPGRRDPARSEPQARDLRDPWAMRLI